MLLQIRAMSELFPEPIREHRFHPDRQWRADFAWPDIQLLLEVDGGIYMRRAGHTTGAGYTKDRERDAEALVAGWVVLRVTSDQVRSGQALMWLAKVYKRLALGH